LAGGGHQGSYRSRRLEQTPAGLRISVALIIKSSVKAERRSGVNDFLWGPASTRARPRTHDVPGTRKLFFWFSGNRSQHYEERADRTGGTDLFPKKQSLEQPLYAMKLNRFRKKFFARKNGMTEIGENSCCNTHFERRTSRERLQARLDRPNKF